MLEIERKFIVTSDDYKKVATKQFPIIQGFLNTHPHRTVRVRIKADKAYLTIKGIGNESGTTRYEWENEIKIEEAKELLSMCEEGIIDKIRYEVIHDGFLYEIDEFFGDNEGLLIGEIELKSEKQAFTKPSWIGQEVTGDNKYYNSYLSKKPYKNW